MRIKGYDRLHVSKKHFTKPPFADGLLNLIDFDPSCVLDPAVGHGALLLASNKRWPDANLIGFDVSEEAVAAAKINLPNARLSCTDALCSSWKVGGRRGNSLLVVCNPPFLGESLLPIKKRLDFQFLNRCISTLKGTDLLLFVFPKSVASSPSFHEVRVEWLSRCQLSMALELPQNAFQNTEASAIAVILKPGKPTGNNFVKFMVMDHDAKIIQQTRAKIDSSFRFDPMYYVLTKRIPKLSTEVIPLGDITQDVKRGIFVRGKSLRRKLGHSYIHSTNMRHGWIANIDKTRVGADTRTNVDTGSVLLSRVGKKLWEKFALYTSSPPRTASDCLYVMKTENLVTSGYLAAVLSTRFMQLSIRRMTRGTTVPILNKKELLALPIPWLPQDERCAIGKAWTKAKSRIQRAALTEILETRLSCGHSAEGK
jgi:predicted RNA methylase